METTTFNYVKNTWSIEEGNCYAERTFIKKGIIFITVVSDDGWA